MSEKLNIATMTAAFKRAAEKARYGTREERSGRFLLKVKNPSARSDKDRPRQESGRRKPKA
jgi:hypothetical protein